MTKNAPVCARAQSPIPPTRTGAPVCGRPGAQVINRRRTREPAQMVSAWPWWRGRNTATRQPTLPAIPKGFELKSNGLEIPAVASFKQIEAAWAFFNRVDAVSNWAKGDLLRFSEAKHGEKYAQLMDSEKDSYGHLRNCKYVAEKFDLSLRSDKPWHYYKEAASLDTDVALELIERANTKRKLIESVKAYKQQKKFRDKAEAMRAYAKQAKDFEMANWAAEIRIRAERKRVPAGACA